MRPSSPPDYRAETTRSRSVSPEPAQWESLDFPTHSGRPRRTQSHHLYEMLQVMLAELDVEISQRGGGMDARERLARERQAYDTAGAELIRQLRTENKVQAALVQKVLSRAWELTDEVMPALDEHASREQRAWVDRDAVAAELGGSEANSELLRERVARVELALWTARRRAASAEVKYEAEHASRTALEAEVAVLTAGKAAAEAEAKGLAEDLKGARWTIDELEQSHATSQLEIEHLTNDLAQLKSRLAADAFDA